jgi:hypothetical protein
MPALLIGRMLAACLAEVYAIGLERRQRNAARAPDNDDVPRRGEAPGLAPER